MAPTIKRLLKQLLKKTQERILGENPKENSALNKSEIDRKNNNKMFLQRVAGQCLYWPPTNPNLTSN